MHYLTWVIAVGVLVFGGMSAYKTSQAEQVIEEVVNSSQSPIVLELFTSQSCSSCPPADKLLGELSQNPDVIALGCHVTYWDHLSWKDTLSLPVCTERQRDYANARGTGRIFTPELKVNGSVSVVGSNTVDVARALKQQAGRVIKLDIAPKGEGFMVSLPPNIGAVEAFFLPYKGDSAQHIPSGENRGLTVGYTNPVSAIALLPVEKGRIDIPANYINQDIKGFAVLLHEKVANGLGAVIAAGKHFL